MSRILQRLLLAAYSLLRGPLQSTLGRRLFLAVYDAYKRRLEARELPALQPLVRRGSTVIDVGANVGFFTTRFAEWTGASGSVIAIEPEARNAADLRRLLARRALAHVECIQAAAGATDGSAHLVINPAHPADHRLGAGGVRVDVVAIDTLVAQRGWPNVSLIKIDVQGGELGVVRGARETIARSKPALYVEVDDHALRQQGATAAQLVEVIESFGYRAYAVPGEALLSLEMIQARTSGGRYADVLWLASTPGAASPRG
jgi:FkbM family methyltransferase